MSGIPPYAQLASPIQTAKAVHLQNRFVGAQPTSAGHQHGIPSLHGDISPHQNAPVMASSAPVGVAPMMPLGSATPVAAAVTPQSTLGSAVSTVTNGVGSAISTVTHGAGSLLNMLI